LNYNKNNAKKKNLLEKSLKNLFFNFLHMKFRQLISHKMAPEWSEAYIDYKLLKTILKPLKFMGKKYLNVSLQHHNTHKDIVPLKLPKYTVSNFTKADIEYLRSFNDKFEYMIKFEFDKITAFFRVQLLEKMKKFRLFQINVSIIQTMKGEKDYYSSKCQLKNCFHLYYKEISLLLEYYKINYEALRKILKKQKKLCGNFSSRLPFTPIKLDSLYTENSFLTRNLSKLEKLKQDLETQYIDFFYTAKRKTMGRVELNKIAQGKLISNWENFNFGLFSGFTILLIIIILILGIKGDLDPDSDHQFTHIFHIYRGLALFSTYMWLLGWNVYGWTKYHINYRNIFRFNFHYSTLSEILRRAAIFTTIVLLTFLWYVVIDEEDTVSSYFLYYQKEFCPLIGWFSLFIYIFFPSISYFNGEGRVYLFKIMKNMLISCFYVDFTLAWATNNMLSFVIPIRDLEYTICYYVNRTFLNNDAEVCFKQDKISIAFIAASLPLILRIIQCMKSMYVNEHRFTFNADFYNIMKYFCSLITVFLSLGVNLDPTNNNFFYSWIFFAILSTFCAYYWDLKMDWGFLDPNAKYKYLRQQLSYSNIFLYYLAISINLLFRFAWILSLSPAIVHKTLRKELFTFVLGFIEMIRRAIWNFFKVEKEHIANCGMFRVVENYKLPFENIKYNIDEKHLTYADFETYDLTVALKKKVSFNDKFREQPSFIGKNLEDLITKLKIPPKHSLKSINKEIADFKNFVDRRFNDCFIINEDGKSIINGNTFSSHKSIEEDSYLMVEDKEPKNKTNKLKRSIMKLLRETPINQQILMENPDEKYFLHHEHEVEEIAIRRKGPANKQTYSIDVRQKKR